jgi:hypothetical protein
MKIPRTLSLMIFAASCTPGPNPTPDSGTPDAGGTDAGTMDAGSDGSCTVATLNTIGCDAGAGLGQGYCTLLTDPDGGTYPYCEGAV